jgi:Glycosyl hydrolase family 12/Cellulose binding domain
VASSSIDNATNGSPGAYPSLYQGCHWGNCSSGGLAATPIQVSHLTRGKVTTSWSTTQPGGSNAYDVAYDIWFNRSATTAGQPDCAELMVWLNHHGSVQPFGSLAAAGVTVGGHRYNVWEGAQAWGDTITYDMTAATASVSGLDVGTLGQDAVNRGYLSRSCYLIDVEAGFELWQGGAGLTTSSFSVSVSRGPVPSPSPAPTSSPFPNPSGSASCSAAYSLVNTWPGGFQGQVAITNTGAATLHSWTIGWTFPGDQLINDLWNGSYAQSGRAVTVTNASYNGTVAAGGTVTVGFTGTYAGNDTPPAGVRCG